ncbi:hypothetical protein SAMN05443432_11277 [Roseovarius litoreus]|uniref:Uncharacterized protein n=1 Tax=Roseovarius litoreus TaxID=1155722 RepID=A0A1M7KYT6_9RHOB|nr:hypothetical protein [Roseovarius litoreus]SHM70795.1 hypothetical protein SAMN05443432_11277 [Roseovarius litoreus]
MLDFFQTRKKGTAEDADMSLQAISPSQIRQDTQETACISEAIIALSHYCGIEVTGSAGLITDLQLALAYQKMVRSLGEFSPQDFALYVLSIVQVRAQSNEEADRIRTAAITYIADKKVHLTPSIKAIFEQSVDQIAETNCMNGQREEAANPVSFSYMSGASAAGTMPPMSRSRRSNRTVEQAEKVHRRVPRLSCVVDYNRPRIQGQAMTNAMTANCDLSIHTHETLSPAFDFQRLRAEHFRRMESYKKTQLVLLFLVFCALMMNLIP